MSAEEIAEEIKVSASKIPSGTMLEKIKYIEMLKQLIGDLEGEL